MLTLEEPHTGPAGQLQPRGCLRCLSPQLDLHIVHCMALRSMDRGCRLPLGFRKGFLHRDCWVLEAILPYEARSGTPLTQQILLDSDFPAPEEADHRSGSRRLCLEQRFLLCIASHLAHLPIVESAIDPLCKLGFLYLNSCRMLPQFFQKPLCYAIQSCLPNSRPLWMESGQSLLTANLQ